MEEKEVFYLLAEKAVPEVLLKVVEAKRLLEGGKVSSVQEAADATGISRSSFYKYKDDIFLYHPNQKGQTVTMVIQLADEPGLLSDILRCIASMHGNILTIHQSIPVNGIAALTISLDVWEEYASAEAIREHIEAIPGISYAKILSRE